MRVVIWALTGAAGLAIALVLLVASQQRRLIYHPNPAYLTPAAAGLADVEELRLPVAGGETVIAWWAKAPPGRPTVLYFHGNGGSLADRRERIRKYQAARLGVFIMAYRGYSGSTGSPSEAANIADARIAYGRLTSAGVGEQDIVIYGESLGTGVATQMAVWRKPFGLILDAPYTSLIDLGKDRFPLMPVSLLMVDRYETRKHIAGLKVPLLVVHGEFDEIIPMRHGQQVLAMASVEDKEMAVIAGARHADHSQFGSYAAIFDWIERRWQGRNRN